MEKNNLFEQESIGKTYISLALPVTLGMVLSVIYNMADTYFIAAVQDTDLVAAVSLCAPVFTMLMAFGNIFGQGGTSLISRLFGGQDERGTKSVSSFCFYASLMVGLLMGILMIVFHRPLLALLGADQNTFEHAKGYFLTMAAGAPFVVESFIYMNLLRAEGMSKESMIGSAAGLIVNIILDPIFISGLGWGAFGAALASVIGYVFSDIFLLAIVLKKSHILSIDPKLALIPVNSMLQIFAIGLSAAVTNILSGFSLILLNRKLLTFGNAFVAAMGIAQKVSMIILLVLTGMSFGAAPMVGYYYGAAQKQRLRKLLLFLLKTVGGTAITLTFILFRLARPAVGIFLKEETLAQTAVLMLRWQIVTMPLAAAIMIITICFQACGKAGEALISSVCRQGIVFFIVLTALSVLFGYNGILASQAVTDLVTVLLLGTLFLKRLYREL